MDINSKATFLKELSQKISWEDYLIFSIVIALSGSFGIYYGFFGSKQKSNKEFLLGNRQMKIIPTAFSLCFTQVSGIGMLGFPAELYLYGTQVMLFNTLFWLIGLVLYFFYIPVFTKLELTSSFQYFQLRFNHSLRIIASSISIIILILVISFVIYGPAISIAQVTGLNHRITIIAIFVVSIFYSTLGGLRAVVLTDTLQGIVVIISLLIVVIFGFVQLGSSTIWNRLYESNRVHFGNWDFDPRVRYTVWSSTIGFFFYWLSVFGSTQPFIQRYISLPNQHSIKWALILSMFLFTIVLTLFMMSGMVIFAYYHDCDPVKNKIIKSYDQLYPLLVMEMLGGYHGIPGLIISGITCAGLSSVSTVVNSLSAIIVEDYVKKFKPDLSDKKLAIFSKLISLISGIIAFGVVFALENVESILPMAFSIQSSMCGATLGLFTLGLMFPWANSFGATIGFFTSFIIMFTLSIGSALAKMAKMLPNQILPLSTQGCSNNNFKSSLEFLNYSKSLNFTKIESGPTSGLNEIKISPVIINILSLSYIWYAFLGTIIVIIVGLPLSLLSKNERVNADLISPPIIKILQKLFPKKIENWIDFENKNCSKKG